MLVLWTALSQTVATDLPSPARTWSESSRYVLEPFFKDGEMNQGILRLAFYSLVRVAKGYLLALLIGTPVGFMLGLSRRLPRGLRSDHSVPAADLAAGLAAARAGDLPQVGAGGGVHHRALRDVADGDQHRRRRASISQDYLNVGRVLKLSRWKMLAKIIVPASLPYVFTGYRLSLGLAWLVIVAAEMLTGTPGVGGFLWQEYNSLVYSHIILSVVTIGAIGFLLDRLMGVVETRFKTA